LKTPCLIIAFSRTAGIERLLASLNPSEISELFVVIDGPTSPAVESIQIEIRSIVEMYSSQNDLTLKVWQRTENFGVAKGIISAIDWFFSYVDYGVVLEDDLEIGQDFFRFADENKNLLDSIDDLLLISGNQFHQNVGTASDLNWTNYPLIWGWATTKIKWNEMRLGILDVSFDLKSNFFNRVSNFWRVGALRVRALEVDTWDIPLANYMLTHKKLCLTPNVNLVSNRGVDEFAAHTTTSHFPLNLPIGTLNSFVVSEFPNERNVEFCNNFLEKSVFKIKTRHRFVYCYFLITKHFRPTRNCKGLSQALSRVEIPKSI
jgi:hypothetical protein